MSKSGPSNHLPSLGCLRAPGNSSRGEKWSYKFIAARIGNDYIELNNHLSDISNLNK